MLGSQFVRQFARRGAASWEAAALALAREDAEGKTGGATGLPPNLTPWPWVDLTLTDGTNTATVRMMSDAFALGPFGDHLRLPMTPGTAQSIFNLFGWLLPTPWLVYQFWRAAPYKLAPIAMVPNKGADLVQFADHSALVDYALDAKIAPGSDVHPALPTPVLGGVSGAGKNIVVSNIWQPGKVLIQGWYRPPPAPDVFDDHRPLSAENRQPIQPNSNVHAADYEDYSHLAQAVHPVATLNGQPIPTIVLYQHPVFSHLVSNEGPIKVPRYPNATVRPPAGAVGQPFVLGPASKSVVDRVVPTTPPLTAYYLDAYTRHLYPRAA